MVLTSIILAAAMVAATAQEGISQNDPARENALVASVEAGSLSAAAADANAADSKTKPVSTPLPKNTLNLKAIPFKIVHETYRETNGKRNWELFIRNADGSDPVNLTNTPDVDEMYPHVSPDATKICFVTDEGKGRNRVRHVYYMNLDGTNRVHVAANAREPCWSFDSKSIAYLKGEYERFTTREYATSGLTFYHLEDNLHQPHENTELHHLYAICWSPDGKWFVAAVQGGMGYSDTIVAFEAFGRRVFDLERWGVRGCRPDLNSDGTRMVWGETDWNVQTGEIDLKSDEPKVTNVHDILRVARQYKIYHFDISPDSKYIVFSYGSVSGGQQVGGMAPDWDLCVSDLDGNWVQITDEDLSDKEPDWVPLKN